jgi:hypothetical protein
MLASRSRRAAALLTITALGAGASVAASPAQAQLSLGGLLPNLGQILTGTGQTLGGLLPGSVGGVVTGVTGTVGGLVGGVQTTVTSLVDQTLGGVVGGDLLGLPTDAVDSLLGTLLHSSAAAPGTPGLGAPGSGAPIVLSGGKIGAGGVILDASAPRTTVTILSKLTAIGRNGKMKMEIKTDEPGIIAVGGKLRPGALLKVKDPAKLKAAKAKHSTKLIKVPSIVLGYRQAGKLDVSVQLSRAAQRALATSKDAKMSVGTVAVDVFRNQGSESTKIKIKR